VCSFPINNDINRFRFFFLSCFIELVIEFFFKKIGFSLSRSKNKSLKSGNVFLSNNTSNTTNLNSIVSKKSCFLTDSSISWLSLELVLKLRQHQLTNSQNLVIISQIHQFIVCFLYLNILILNKFFLFLDIILNFFQKELYGLFLRLLNSLNVFSPSLNRGWFFNFDIMFVTLIEDVIKFFLAILTVLDLLSVWKIVWRLLRVNVNKVCFTNFTNVV